MDENQLDENRATALIAVLAVEPQPPSGVDIDLAVQRSRRRRRSRRLRQTGVLIASIALIAAGVNVVRGRPTPTVSAVAPTGFDPLVRYVDFDWLPKGFQGRKIAVAADGISLDAAPETSAGNDQQNHIRLSLTPAGATRGTNSGKNPSLVPDLMPAPRVKGSRAYWLTEKPRAGGLVPTVAQPPATPQPSRTARAGAPQCAISYGLAEVESLPVPNTHASPTALCWEYAKDAWASLTLPAAGIGGDSRETALRIANGVRFGLRTPIFMPFRLTVSAVRFTVISSMVETLVGQSGNVQGNWRYPWHTELMLSDSRPGASTRGAERWVKISVTPSAPASVILAGEQAPNTTIDGHQAYRAPIDDEGGRLIVYGVQGFNVEIDTAWKGDRDLDQIFRGMTLLGPDTRYWTQPVG